MGTIIKSGIVYLGEGATTPFTGATASTDGEKGLVPAPLAGDESKFLKGDGTWGTPSAGLPSGWEATDDHIRGTVLSGVDYNSLGWGTVNDEVYYDTAASWVLTTDYSGGTCTKSNAIPCLAAVCSQVSPMTGYSIIAMSTDINGISTNWPGVYGQGTIIDSSLNTWYYKCYGVFSSMNGTNMTYIGLFSSYDAIANALLNYADVKYRVYEETFSQISLPSTGYLFAGGGEEDDMSDATFTVLSNGTVNGSDFKINGNSITDTFTGATSSTDGVKGMVPAPTATENNKFLKGDGTWDTPSAGLPEAWEVTEEHIRGTVSSDIDFGSLGWGAVNDEVYYDTATTWKLNSNSICTRATSLPCLAAAWRVSSWYHLISISTDNNALVSNWSGMWSGTITDKLMNTWYCKDYGNAYDIDGTNMTYIGAFSNALDAANALLDYADIKFRVYEETFAQVSLPSSGYLFVGGGEENDLSDATFKVSTAGVVDATSYKINGETAVVDITQAEYDALPASKLTNSVQYYITDGNYIMRNGRKYGETGSIVVPNSQQTPTAVLTTLTIDGVVYSLPSGGIPSVASVSNTITVSAEVTE